VNQIVTLWTNNRSLVRAVTEAVSPNLVDVRRPSVTNHPKRADALVTKAALSGATSVLEMAYRCTQGPFVLPEAGDSLLRAVAEGKVKTLIGNDLANPRSMTDAALSEAA
jgi:hypothetical protein